MKQLQTQNPENIRQASRRAHSTTLNTFHARLCRGNWNAGNGISSAVLIDFWLVNPEFGKTTPLTLHLWTSPLYGSLELATWIHGDGHGGRTWQRLPANLLSQVCSSSLCLTIILQIQNLGSQRKILQIPSVLSSFGSSWKTHLLIRSSSDPVCSSWSHWFNDRLSCTDQWTKIRVLM